MTVRRELLIIILTEIQSCNHRQKAQNELLEHCTLRSAVYTIPQLHALTQILSYGTMIDVTTTNARQLDTTLSPYLGPTQYVCDSCVNETTVRPPTPRDHTLLSTDSLAYVVGGFVIGTITRLPDTIFIHPLPNRFSMRVVVV